jgi:hypothetical protein
MIPAPMAVQSTQTPANAARVPRAAAKIGSVSIINAKTNGVQKSTGMTRSSYIGYRPNTPPDRARGEARRPPLGGRVTVKIESP